MTTTEAEPITTKIFFTHRPKLGMSLGVKKVGPTLYVAVAITNNGETVSRNYRPERNDNFSRSRAREIIRGRLNSCIETDTPYALSLEVGEDFDLAKFNQELRDFFKPDHQENEPSQKQWWRGCQFRTDMWSAVGGWVLKICLTDRSPVIFYPDAEPKQ